MFARAISVTIGRTCLVRHFEACGLEISHDFRTAASVDAAALTDISEVTVGCRPGTENPVPQGVRPEDVGCVGDRRHRVHEGRRRSTKCALQSSGALGKIGNLQGRGQCARRHRCRVRAGGLADRLTTGRRCGPTPAGTVASRGRSAHNGGDYANSRLKQVMAAAVRTVSP